MGGRAKEERGEERGQRLTGASEPRGGRLRRWTAKVDDIWASDIRRTVEWYREASSKKPRQLFVLSVASSGLVWLCMSKLGACVAAIRLI